MAKTRTKKLGYNVAPSVSLAGLAQAWRGFTFLGGPVRCVLSGPWGMIQVWAATEEEGKRVARHALSAGGWSGRESEGAWSARVVTGPRHSNGREWTTAESDGVVGVSMREGPAGLPDYPDA